MRMQVVLHPEDIDSSAIGILLDSVDVAVIVMRQFAGPDEAPVTCRKRKHISDEPSGMAL
jgi:hypothetical protein